MNVVTFGEVKKGCVVAGGGKVLTGRLQFHG
jgi:hypothetical protein